MMTDNRVLFHRMANTLNYLDIKTVLVSCGTCYDQLATYEFEKIFPGCRIMDIHEYLLEKGVKLEGVNGTRYMYHEPCHNPMKLQDSVKTVNALVSTVDNVKIEKNDRCCGESGTFGVSRPDIATQVRYRKEARWKRARPSCARRLRRRRQDPHQLPVLPARPVALQRRRGHHRRLHRRRDRAPPAGRELDAGVRGPRQQRRHRAGAGMSDGCELCELAVPPIYRDDKLSVILVDDPAYPGFCRVIWNEHVKEMSDLAPPTACCLTTPSGTSSWRCAT
jgi:hypothetical protein